MLYDSLSDKVQRSYSRFTDDVYSGRFRKDGKLIVAGSKDGYVKVFDMKTKAVLRQIKRHTAAVRATVWSSDGLHIISGRVLSFIICMYYFTEKFTWRIS